MTGLEAGGCLGDGDAVGGLDGVAALTGGCVVVGGGLEGGVVVVGTLEGEAAGACALAKTNKIAKEAGRKSHRDVAILCLLGLIEQLGLVYIYNYAVLETVGVKGWCFVGGRNVVFK